MYKDMYDAYRKFEDERFSVYRSRLAAAAGGAAAAADEALAAAELQSGPNDDVINRGESNANLAPATGQIWARMLDAFLGNECASLHATYITELISTSEAVWQHRILRYMIKLYLMYILLSRKTVLLNIE
jgi:hypothetical protein